MFELGFLEVRHHPHIVHGHDIQQGNARRHKAADTDLAITDDAIHGGAYHGAVQIDPCQLARGLGLGNGGNGRFALGLQHGNALLLRLHAGRRGRERRASL
ncbi:hypothetical protein D3C81_1679760 [compost metagenome]